MDAKNPNIRKNSNSFDFKTIFESSSNDSLVSLITVDSVSRSTDSLASMDGKPRSKSFDSFKELFKERPNAIVNNYVRIPKIAEPKTSKSFENFNSMFSECNINNNIDKIVRRRNRNMIEMSKSPQIKDALDIIKKRTNSQELFLKGSSDDFFLNYI